MIGNIMLGVSACLGVIGYAQNFNLIIPSISIATAIALALRAVFWLPFKRHEAMQTAHAEEKANLESELNYLKEQAAPLRVGASSTFPLVGKDNTVWKDKLVISISNQNPRREVKGVVVRLLGISPPLKMRQIYGFCTTDDCGLGGIKLPFSDIPGDVLNGGVTGHIPIFEAERTAIITIVKFCGVWASAHANHFIPSPNEKYVLTVEATAAGLERKESRFEISFSLTPTHPIVAATEIVDAPSHAPLLESSQRKIPCGI